MPEVYDGTEIYYEDDDEPTVQVTCDECKQPFDIPEWQFLEDIQFGDPWTCPSCMPYEIGP